MDIANLVDIEFETKPQYVFEGIPNQWARPFDIAY